MFTIDVNEGAALDIGDTCTTKDFVDIASKHCNGGTAFSNALITAAIDAAANGNLRLHRRSSKEHHQTDYGIFNSQLLSIISKFFTKRLPSGCPSRGPTTHIYRSVPPSVPPAGVRPLST